VERVGRRTLLAVGGSVIAATMALLAMLLAAVPMGPALLPVALVLLCVNRVALTCTLQPLAATGVCCCFLHSLLALHSSNHLLTLLSSLPMYLLLTSWSVARRPACSVAAYKLAWIWSAAAIQA
jgi:hypothetical protein